MDADSVIILSPHFDDSVLSCGGQIWQRRQHGQPVRVIILFAGPPLAAAPPFARVQHAMWGDPPDPNRLRRAEDRVAHARLGCFDLVHLEMPDAVYRIAEAQRPLYDSEEAIFGTVHPAEETLPDRLCDLLTPHLPQTATVWAPLGVGHHVDHQLGYIVGQTLLGAGWRVAFYEELPYIERPAALERALAASAGPLQVEVSPLSEAAIDAKIAAAAYYRSQVPVLYGDEATMARRIRASARAAGHGYAERLWWPQQAAGPLQEDEGRP